MADRERRGPPEYKVYRSGSAEPKQRRRRGKRPPAEPARPEGKSDRPEARRPGGPVAGRPEYTVYRSRPGFLSRVRPEGGWRLRPRPGPRQPGPPGEGRPGLTLGRVLRWIALALLVWVLLSFVVFLVSAQLNQGASDRTEDALSSGGSLLTGSTILVLGSDARPKGSREPGAGGPSRSDSILLLRVRPGQVRRLSVLRDSYAPIPGYETQKINAAYALGGPALAIKAVEGFLGNGLEVNHVVEVSFEDFPGLIDALGGIDVKLRRGICAPPFGNFPRGFRLRRGEHHLNGYQALGFARVRNNPCAPGEDDRARAARQQQVLSAMRGRLFSPSTFVRLPWVGWQAPRTFRSDMAGPGLSGLFLDIVTGGAGETRILKPIGDGPGGSLIVSEDERRDAVRYLLGE